MIGPFEVETEWVDTNGWRPPSHDQYRESNGYFSYVALYEYVQDKDGKPVPKLIDQRSDPSEDYVDFLRRAVNALNRAAAIRRVS